MAPRPTKNFDRKAKRRALPRVLLSTEDELLGRSFARHVKSVFRDRLYIKVNEKCSGEPLGLVEATAERLANAERRREDQYQSYSLGVCLIDIEAPRRHDRLPDALSLARDKGIVMITANPCFEIVPLMLWGRPVTSPLSTRDAETRLAAADTGYDPSQAGGKDLDFDDRRPDLRELAKRAAASRPEEGGFDLVELNPGTNVDLLIQYCEDPRKTFLRGRSNRKCIPGELGYRRRGR
ncbi:RloB domain-containing protein [Salininema proteolyticum]|uniref:RloB domain-containing protein n=1 Tax=Salininema proteolyticum TaxID=1607685 RepID=A0ABV8U2U8_9ACTN